MKGETICFFEIEIEIEEDTAHQIDVPDQTHNYLVQIHPNNNNCRESFGNQYCDCQDCQDY